MDAPRRHSQAASPFRFRAPVSLVVFAMSLVLSLLLGDGSPLDRCLLDVEHPTLRAFAASHLLYTSGWHLVITLPILLVFAGILESRWGTPYFVIFYLGTAWGCTFVTVVTARAAEAAGTSCGGAGVALAGLVAVGLLYPDHRLVWTLPAARYLSWCLALLGAMGLALLDLQGGAFLFPQVAGVAFGLGFGTFEGRYRSLVEAGRARRRKREEARLLRIRSQVDRLLEKISASGIDSLTADERDFLRDASKHFHP